MRSIDADALIDALMAYTWRDEDERLIDDVDEKREFIKNWMPDLPTVATDINVPNKWISVKDRMPSEEEAERTKFGFLCYIIGFFIMPDGFAILPYNKEAKAFWNFYNNHAIDNVTHWMPLPEPPMKD